MTLPELAPAGRSSEVTNFETVVCRQTFGLSGPVPVRERTDGAISMNHSGGIPERGHLMKTAPRKNPLVPLLVAWVAVVVFGSASVAHMLDGQSGSPRSVAPLAGAAIRARD